MLRDNRKSVVRSKRDGNMENCSGWFMYIEISSIISERVIFSVSKKSIIPLGTGIIIIITTETTTKAIIISPNFIV